MYSRKYDPFALPGLSGREAMLWLEARKRCNVTSHFVSTSLHINSTQGLSNSRRAKIHFCVTRWVICLESCKSGTDSLESKVFDDPSVDGIPRQGLRLMRVTLIQRAENGKRRKRTREREREQAAVAEPAPPPRVAIASDDGEGEAPDSKDGEPGERPSKKRKTDGHADEVEVDATLTKPHNTANMEAGSEALKLMPAVDALFKTVEGYRDMNVEYLTFSKISKVMRHIHRLDANKVPRDDEFHFRKRAKALVEQWDGILSSRLPRACVGEEASDPAATHVTMDDG
ncbi:hypothetical protein C8R45DRAFT_944646 [Mycena sanguinolenta]|nr:hypothetical protein C8R45DRAFT_944646 [Mycena sanguinolenta]